MFRCLRKYVDLRSTPYLDYFAHLLRVTVNIVLDLAVFDLIEEESIGFWDRCLEAYLESQTIQAQSDVPNGTVGFDLITPHVQLPLMPLLL